MLAAQLGEPGLVPLRVLLFRTGDAAARRQPSILIKGSVLGAVLATVFGDLGLVDLSMMPLV